MKKLSILLVALLTSVSAMSQFPPRFGGGGAGAGAGAGGAGGAGGLGGAASGLSSSPQTFAQDGTFQIGDKNVSGQVTKLPDGSFKVTTTGGETMTLSPTANPGTFTVTQSTVPGVVAGTGTTVTVKIGTLTGAVTVTGFGVGGMGVAATLALASFVAVVNTTTQNRGSTSGSTSN